MGARTDNTIVMIPALNESRAIGGIVRVLVGMRISVLVIDDGSSDGTDHEALKNGAMVIRHNRNLGKGVSVRSGIQHILDKMKYEWIVMMDGDGQHHPEDVPGLMAASERGDVDMVIGNRMDQTRNMPATRYWTNRFTSWVLSKLCGQYVPDSQCGFRLLRAEAMRELKLESSKYDIESEMIIEAAEKGLIIVPAPIQTIYGDESSRINPFRDTIKFFHLVSKHSLRKNAIRRKAKADGRDSISAARDKRS